MLSNELTRWIRNKVQGKYSNADLDSALKMLDYYLELCNDPQEDIRPLELMREATDDEKSYLIKESFTDIETFMKRLCNIAYPGLLETPPEPTPYSSRTSWTLEPLYKQAFKVVPPDFSLSKATVQEGSPGYRYAYVKLYRFRNMNVHEREKMSLSERDVLDYTIYMLIVKLDLCQRCAKELTRQYRAKTIDQKGYTQRICERYAAAERGGFTYVNMIWTPNGSPKNEYDIEKMALSDDSDMRLVKILGEAGTGKSTALQQIEITLARHSMKNTDIPIPIYIELSKLTDGQDILMNEIMDMLCLDSAGQQNLYRELLEDRMVCLLLDGFNEILDPSTRQHVAKEIDKLARTGVRIFMTDRAKARPSDLTLYNATSFYLKPITDEIKKDFFAKNCRDEEIKKLILDSFSENSLYFAGMNTPIKLRQLIDVAVAERKLPADPVRAFIDYLISRERQEKKDENTDYMKDFLAAIAIMAQPRQISAEELDKMFEQGMDEEDILALTNEPELLSISKREAAAQMAKYQRYYGYTNADTNRCLQLAVDMGILVLDTPNEYEEYVSFASRQYQQYFSRIGNNMPKL